MKLTLVFGAPVVAGDTELGKLERIVVNNGIANQVTVDPGLLGYERVVPLSDFEGNDGDALRLRIDPDEWKSYTAFVMNETLEDTTAAETPNLAVLPNQTITAQARDTAHPLGDKGIETTDETVDEMSLVLTTHTHVVDESGNAGERRLRGLVIDTGRPLELLIDDNRSVPFSAVTMFDEERIHVGGHHQQPVLDADRGYERTATEDPAGDERR